MSILNFDMLVMSFDVSFPEHPRDEKSLQRQKGVDLLVSIQDEERFSSR